MRAIRDGLRVNCRIAGDIAGEFSDCGRLGNDLRVKFRNAGDSEWIAGDFRIAGDSEMDCGRCFGLWAVGNGLRAIVNWTAGDLRIAVGNWLRPMFLTAGGLRLDCGRLDGLRATGWTPGRLRVDCGERSRFWVDCGDAVWLAGGNLDRGRQNGLRGCGMGCGDVEWIARMQNGLRECGVDCGDAERIPVYLGFQDCWDHRAGQQTC